MALGKFLQNISVCIATWASLRSLESLCYLISTQVTCQQFLKIITSPLFHLLYLAFLSLTNSDLEQYWKGILGSVIFGDRNDVESTIDNQTYIEGPNIIYHQICLTRFYQNPGHRPAIKMDYNTLKNQSYCYDF